MKKNNKKIINSANRTLSRELSSIKNLKSTFNTNFCEAVNIIYNTKGKIVKPEFNVVTPGQELIVPPFAPVGGLGLRSWKIEFP